jgi:hypothetical protein
MASIPSALALALIPDNSLITASPHRNNYAAIQAAVNALIARSAVELPDSSLQALDGTDVQWGNSVAGLLIGKMLAMSSANAAVTAGTLPTAGIGYTRISSTDGSNVANITGGNVATSSQILFLWNATGSTVTFVTGGAAGSALRTGFSLGDGHGALLLYETVTQTWVRLGIDDPASTAATLAQVFAAGVQSAHPSQGVGYATGAGGSVTQPTSQTTAVTLNKACGKITMFNAAFNTGALVTFTVNNSTVVASDLIVVNAGVGGIIANAVAANGSFTVTLYNAGPNTFTGQVNFAVVKAVTA